VPRIAFFDVDRTILSANSATLWIQREWRLGHLGVLDLLRAVFWLTLYALGFARMERVLADAVATLRGQDEPPLRERSMAFWHEDLRRRIRPGARAALAEHRARGDRVFLLTTTSSYLARAISEELGCDGYLCNEMEVDGGRFTGRFTAALCYGEGKLDRARELSQQLGVALAECTYYGDSFSDLPILLGVGTPVAVNPDPRLRREALRRAWRIADWGEEEKSA
jgi:HAD superfamily hydrolase (TIGR01490 family)